MMDQKGIAFIPLLIWSFVGLATVSATVLGTEIIKDNINLETSVSVIPTPSNCPKGWISTQTGCLELQKDSDIPITSPVKKSVSTSQTIINGSRSGSIIPYKEYCSGKQISVYENEILTKVSPFDGKTYSMTQGDWDCYANNSQRKTTITNTSTYPPCTVYYKYSGESKTYDYMTSDQCSYWQQKANTAYTPPANLGQLNYTPAPLPTYPPYQPSQEYLDSLNKANQVFTEQWQPSQFVAPTPTPTPEIKGYIKVYQ